jgi:hypothetical protein
VGEQRCEQGCSTARRLTTRYGHISRISRPVISAPANAVRPQRSALQRPPVPTSSSHAATHLMPASRCGHQIRDLVLDFVTHPGQ